MTEIILCDRCKKKEKARFVRAPRDLFLCWECWDAWRRWYLGPAAYKYATPLDEVKRQAGRIEPDPQPMELFIDK